MDAQAHPTKTTLPGIGTRYDLVTESGKHVSVVVHNDGRRFLGFHKPEDDDECQASVPLGPGDAAALAQLLLPERIDPVRGEIEIDLVTEHIPVGTRSPYFGRTLGDTQARSRTGASIVAVLRRTGATPSPAPDFRFATGDTLVVVGTREGVDAVADLIAGGKASGPGSGQPRAGARRSAAQGGGQGSEWGSPSPDLQRRDLPAERRAARPEPGPEA